MRKKIGLYFGSFNPIHHGHLIIASYIADHTELKEIWLMVSPRNPFKKESSLLNQNHRLRMVQDATEDDDRLKASNFEFNLPTPSFTVDTLISLEEKLPGNEFSVIMGADSFQNISNWKNAEYILNNFKIFVYPRVGFFIDAGSDNICIVQAPQIEISSTMIRKNIKAGLSVKYLVPEKVLSAIEIAGYYREKSEDPSK